RSTATAPDFDVGVEVRRDEILTSPLLPGFELALERLFG
ncbi:MAG: Uma2 family endonuclease, partial [Solirubrobacterales bacterium]|nr:Uma2 family endonuclease [Solirubrobacterales bacterium]